jgi:hypothetical protein
MEETEMALTEEHYGPGGRASPHREPSLTTGLRVPGIIPMGPARKVGNAMIGGSLENSLSHRPAGRKAVERWRIQ